MFSADDLRRSLAGLTPAAARGYVLCISGGADSTALVAAAAQLREQGLELPLRAVHVNHGLQPAAEHFAAVSERVCKALDLPLTVLALAAAATRGRSLEEWAREARYQALARNLQPGECLLTAHQLEDQAETFLLQALRGAGPDGLAAMPARCRFGAGWHLRPLLRVSRQSLRAYLARRGIEPVEDVMNTDPRLDRVYLRQAVWPALLRRWPAAATVLARSAAHLGDVSQEQRAQAADELAQVCDGEALSLPAMRHLSFARQCRTLRAFMAARGVRAPSQARLAEVLRQMYAACEDAAPWLCWEGHALRRYRHRLYLTPERLPMLSEAFWCWRDTAVLDLGADLGQLRLVPRPGGLDPERLADRLRIGVRCGPQSLRIEPGGRAHSLRNLLQAAGIVPWQRARLPLLHSGESLVAVAHLWRASGWCVPSAATGLAVEWCNGPALS